MMESKEMAMKIAKLLDERKAIDVQVIDIALKSSFADYFVMASGGSERQMAALVDNIEELLEPEGVFPKECGRNSQLWLDPHGLRRCCRQRDDSRNERKI